MGNYLITGAAGFIGAALAKRMINEGHQVVTIDNLSTGLESNIPERTQFYYGDCADPDVYNRIPQLSYEAIFHIAGQSSGEISFDDPIYDIKTNTESTLLLLKYALEHKCSRFIYASTMSVYGVKQDKPVTEEEDCYPQSFYGVGKLASEHYIRIYQQYGIASTILRLFNVYGPGQNLDNLRQGMVSIFLAQMIRNGHIHVKGSPQRYRDFIHIDDVVESFVRCLGRSGSEGRIINIGTSTKTTVHEIVQSLISGTETEISVDYSGSTAGDLHGIYADTQKMASILGMSACIPLEKGIKDMVAWAREIHCHESKTVTNSPLYG